MSTDRSHDVENRRQRERLQAVTDRLTEAEVGRPMPAGWTVGAVLGHLAFWDQRALVLLEEWARDNFGALPRRLDEGDVDWINDATKPFLLALAPRRAAELAMAAANAADRAVAALSDDAVTRNAAGGHPVNLLRAEHRREHLDEIERALGG